MKRCLYIFPLFIACFFFLGAKNVHAGDCFADPVSVHDWTGSMNIGAFMRNTACMDGSSILVTIPKSTSVHIIGETDGWYYVEYNGGRGWVGSTLVTVTKKRFDGNVWNSYTDYMKTYPAVTPTGSSPSDTENPSSDSPASTSDGSYKGTTNASLLSRTKGYILLQTQSHGEAWYVDPISAKRYYMKDGATAYQMMRSFGLGVSEADYTKIVNGDASLKNRLVGRIILRAQAHGEAYYIHPKTLAVHYLQNGEEAYRVMRLYSLGITNADLSGVPTAEVPVR